MAAKIIAVPMPDFSTASCRNVDPDIFFDDDVEKRDYAPLTITQMCDRCPVQSHCLGWAIATKQRHGMWGGMTPRGRTKLTRPVDRVRCPGCESHAIWEEPTSETCLSCGLTWKI
jgi:WhiB family redox-sensing transcriptional regulator